MTSTLHSILALTLVLLTACIAHPRDRALPPTARDPLALDPLLASAPAPTSDPDPDPDPDRWPTPTGPVPGTFVRVEPATFTMGVTPDDACYRGANAPRHDVTLTRAFEIMDAEITIDDHVAVTGLDPSSPRGCTDACPVNMLTWHLAAAYCNALSPIAGLPECYRCAGEGASARCEEAASPHDCAGYRLPTEAEWELAYRAGTATATYAGSFAICGHLDPTLAGIAWFLYNSDGGTHPVRSLEPNRLGLFDMSGNVWEWAHDGYAELGDALAVDPVGAPHPDGLRVLRGGSYNCLPWENAGAHRSALPSTVSGLNVGGRCARTLPPGE